MSSAPIRSVAEVRLSVNVRDSPFRDAPVDVAVERQLLAAAGARLDSAARIGRLDLTPSAPSALAFSMRRWEGGTGPMRAPLSFHGSGPGISGRKVRRLVPGPLNVGVAAPICLL
jgi:hypothetical protein